MPASALDRLLAEVQAALDALVGPFGRRLGRLVRAAAPDGDPIPELARAEVATAIDRGVDALFGRSPAQVTRLGAALVPVAILLDRGRRGAARLHGQAADPGAWTAPGPDNRRLSDRVWRSGRETRRQLLA